MEGTENSGHAKNQDSLSGRAGEALMASSLAVTSNHEYEVPREGGIQC